jgi:NADH-quinone oxidoreductase subunit M
MLSILLWLPLAAALAGALLPTRYVGWPALGGALGTLGMSIWLIFDYSGSERGLQHVVDEAWVSQLGIHYKLGVDGLNLFLIAMTALLWAAAVLAAGFRTWERPRAFFFWLGLGESAVLGAFLAQDLALFVVFFDLMLVPFLFLTGQWGGPDRIRATVKFVIYTLVGSLLMLAAAVATGVLSTPDGGSISFALSDLRQHIVSSGSQDWIFLFVSAAFLVKMPAFPLHGWMPDAYRAMPIEVLTVFSAVLSKVAAYGFLRIALPLFPEAAARYQTLLLLIALASVLYGSAMAFTTTQARLIAGYSSVAQLGFITLGIFSLTSQGAQGSLLQMVNHGIVVAPLILIIGLLAARAEGSEDIRDMGGLAFRAPVLAALFLIVALANLAMPGATNFVGEFYILLGLFNAKLVIAIVAFTGVALAAVYTLRMYIRTMHNRLGPKATSREMSVADGLVLVPLVLVILVLSVYPQVALKRSQRTTSASIQPAVSALGARDGTATARTTP